MTERVSMAERTSRSSRAAGLPCQARTTEQLRDQTA